MGKMFSRTKPAQSELKRVENGSKRVTTESKTDTVITQLKRVTSGSKTDTVIPQIKGVTSGSKTEAAQPQLKRATTESQGINDNLELYLNDVFDQECVFKIADEEVEFIRTAIETLSQRIVDRVLQDASLQDFVERMFGTGVTVNGITIMDTFEVSLTEYVTNSLQVVYLPMKGDSLFKRHSHNRVKYGRSSIIKVGSFYEGTKNSFPDEFDFLFLLFSGTKEPPSGLTDLHLIGIIHQSIRNVTAQCKHLLCYVSESLASCGKRKIYFDKYVQKHGPASMLQFIYCNTEGTERCIYVDLVPANRVSTSLGIKALLKQEGRKRPTSFLKHLVSQGSCLYVKDSLSFTEAEVHFMRDVLSDKHVKVYRIMKYLINGHGDGEELAARNGYISRNFSFSDDLENYPTGYSSFMIKMLMIHHHNRCSNSDTSSIGPCVLQILENLHMYDTPNQIINSDRSYTEFSLVPYVAKMVKTLKSMRSSRKRYCYKKWKMKSISRQYLDNNRKMSVPKQTVYPDIERELQTMEYFENFSSFEED